MNNLIERGEVFINSVGLRVLSSKIFVRGYYSFLRFPGVGRDCRLSKMNENCHS